MAPRVLIACSDPKFDKWKRHGLVGRLFVPFTGTATKGLRFSAADNAAYSNWDPERFVKMLFRLRSKRGAVKWVAVPDVVGDWKATRDRFDCWHPVVSGLGFRCAYVLQDGQPVDQIPWDRCRAVFLGGTDDYKLSRAALDTLKIAFNRAKLVHVGRVNSWSRVMRFKDMMHSFDGLSYSKFSDAKIPGILKKLQSLG